MVENALARGISRRCAVAWAKSWPYDQAVESWQPLWEHLDNSADIAGFLVDEWVPPGVLALIADVVGGERARVLVVWLAGVHDIGKVTPAFAVQGRSLSDRMVRTGLGVGPAALQDRSKLRHEVAGAAILDRWLSERFAWGKFDRRQLTDIVAGHHGAFPSVRAVQDAPFAPALFGDAAWIEVQNALLDRAAERAGMDPSAPIWQGVRLPQAAQMLVTGIVIMADWIASDEQYFPLIDVEDVPDVRAPTPGPSLRAVTAWRRVNLGRRWAPSPDGNVSDRFRDRFPWAQSGPRDVQRTVAEVAEQMAAPGLMMLEAPMGIGKTEAAFMAAEALAARCGARGCFVALPTQATSNAMFSRMLQWLTRLPDGEGVGTQSVALVHGKAALNDEFRAIPFGRTSEGQIYDDHVSGSETSRYTAVVSEWMRGRKRAALSSFAVGTIDQVLFAALRARHTMLRHLSLAGKVVIIDEVHAADVFMSAFLDRALEWLAACGAPVVLMSATLPAQRRVELYLAYERGRRRRLAEQPEPPEIESAATARLAGDIGYPAIVTTGDDGPRVTVVASGGESRQVHVARLEDDVEILGALLEERLADGGCAVVIRNTVRRAQETGRRLSEIFGAENVTVSHAGFLAVDRTRNDLALLAKFGPSGTSVVRPEKHVVVATQVVEQSLDLDFDFMVTDVAPVDLILQRMGRLHRHERGDGRPERLREARCYITGVDWAQRPPRPEGGASAVYGKWLVYSGLAVLDRHLDGNPVTLPGDIAPLVQAAYAGDVTVPDAWLEEVSVARAKFSEKQAARRYGAGLMTLSPVQAHGRDLYDGGRGGVGVVDEDSPRGQGYVRDGGDSVEVVVVQSGGDGSDRVPDWVECNGERLLPYRHVDVPYAQAKVLARCTLRLPFRLTHEGVIDAVIAELEQQRFDGWRTAPFLSGQLALVLDDDRRALLAGHRLHYDLRYGLEVQRDEE